MNEKLFFFQISLKFVPKGRIDNNTALVQIMAWCRIGHKPLSEPMLTWFTDKYMRHLLVENQVCHSLYSWCRSILLISFRVSFHRNQCQWSNPEEYVLINQLYLPGTLKPLWSSDSIWRHKSGSRLAQIMACCWWHQTITWTDHWWSPAEFICEQFHRKYFGYLSVKLFNNSHFKIYSQGQMS